MLASEVRANSLKTRVKIKGSSAKFLGGLQHNTNAVFLGLLL